VPIVNAEWEVRYTKTDITNKLSQAIQRLGKGNDGLQGAVWQLLGSIEMIKKSAPPPFDVKKIAPQFDTEPIENKFGIRRSAIGERIADAILKLGEDRWGLAVAKIQEALEMLQRAGEATDRKLDFEQSSEWFGKPQKARE
jgi:hypothetical protein